MQERQIVFQTREIKIRAASLEFFQRKSRWSRVSVQCFTATATPCRPRGPTSNDFKIFFHFSRETSRLGDVRASARCVSIDLFRPIRKRTVDSVYTASVISELLLSGNEVC